MRVYWLIFVFNKRADTWIYNLCSASTVKIRQFDNLLSSKKQIDVRFSCVCPVNDSTSWIHSYIVLWQRYDEVHYQYQDRCKRNGHQIVKLKIIHYQLFSRISYITYATYLPDNNWYSAVFLQVHVTNISHHALQVLLKNCTQF